MSWESPDRCWRFAVGDDPPDDLPAAWNIAFRAVTRDLDCRRHGRPITFAQVMWIVSVSEEWVALGFDTDGAADVGSIQSSRGYLLHTSPAQAMVWLAQNVQDQLTGYEFVQWPISGQRILDARLVDDAAVWMEPGTNTVIAPIGQLCSAPADY